MINSGQCFHQLKILRCASLQAKQRPIRYEFRAQDSTRKETYQASEAQMDPPKFLVLGAAGYIGGTVLTDLLKQYTASSITVLVRKPEQEQLFTTLGVNVVSGDVADAAKLKSLASEHDVVLNFGVAFGADETSIQALVDGLEERARETQSKPVLIHEGGSGTVMYGSGGEAGADVWTDEQYDRWSSLSDTASFYGGYKIVTATALRGTISVYIVLSPTVYGRGTGPGSSMPPTMSSSP
ncbi:unnamed protein product [Alternaria alternata]